jgi:hypothetical protein
MRRLPRFILLSTFDIVIFTLSAAALVFCLLRLR